MLAHLDQEVGIVLKFGHRQIELGRAGAIGLSVSGHRYGRRNRKAQDIFDTPLPGRIHKPLLALLLVPVISAVRVLKALLPSIVVRYAAGITLLIASRADVESPERQPNSFWVAAGVRIHAKEIIGYLVFLC